MPKNATNNPNGNAPQPTPKYPSQLEDCQKPRQSDGKAPAGPEKNNLVDTSPIKPLPSPAEGKDNTFHNK